MARENLGQILIDNECAADTGELRALLTRSEVRQGDRILTDKNEKIDTANGPIIVGSSTTIYTWEDHSLS